MFIFSATTFPEWLRSASSKQCTKRFNTATHSPMQRPAAQESFVLDQVLVASTSDDHLQHSTGKAVTQSLCSPTNRVFDVKTADVDAHVSAEQLADRAPSANQSSNNSIQDNRAQQDSASPLLRAPGVVVAPLIQHFVQHYASAAKRQTAWPPTTGIEQ